MISSPNSAATVNQSSILNEPITMSDSTVVFKVKKVIVVKPTKYRSYFYGISKGQLLLLELYNFIWLSGTIPKKEQDIHKPSGYRPIIHLM